MTKQEVLDLIRAMINRTPISPDIDPGEYYLMRQAFERLRCLDKPAIQMKQPMMVYLYETHRVDIKTGANLFGISEEGFNIVINNPYTPWYEDVMEIVKKERHAQEPEDKPFRTVHCPEGCRYGSGELEFWRAEG